MTIPKSVEAHAAVEGIQNASAEGKMEMRKRKLAAADKVFAGILLTGVIGSLLLPDVGTRVLLDELCSVIIILAVGLWLLRVLVMLLRSAAKKKDLVIIAAVMLLCLGAGVGAAKDLILDLMQGPQIIMLTDCDTDSRSTSRGIIGLRYYLTGWDENGERHRFRITGSISKELSRKETWTIECYEHTGRFVQTQVRK